MEGKWKVSPGPAAGHCSGIKTKGKGQENQEESQGSEPEINNWARMLKLKVKDN